jgi:alcohol dehydrogenase class IV
MAELSFSIPSKVLFGSDVLNFLGSLTSSYGSRAILVTEFSLHENRHAERVQNILRKKNIECIVIDDISGPRSRRTISEVSEFTKASRSQIIIGMGGMKCLSAARKVACVSAPGGGTEPREPLPYIEIPTVFRNPLLLTDTYLDRDPSTRNPQIIHTAPGLVKAALIDPSLTSTISEKFTGALLLDSVLNALEGYLSTGANFFSDSLFLSALGLLGDAMDDAVRGVKDLRHRVKASQAGLLTSVGLTTSYTGAGVALSYGINALFGTPKSWIASVLLPHVIDIHLGSRAEKLAEAAKVLGEEIFGLSSADAAQFASERIRRIIAQLGLPARLRDLDLKLNELVEAAEAAATFEMMSHLPLPMTVDGLYDLLKRAY